MDREMARKKDSKASSSKSDVEVRLGFYDRVAAHFASIARSVAVVVGSLLIVAALLIGSGSLAPPAMVKNWLLSGSEPASGKETERPGEQPQPLLGDIHLYFRSNEVKVCSR
jgi:hypothetical protein